MSVLRRLSIIACACVLLCAPTAGGSIGLPVPPIPHPPLPKLPNVNIPDVSALLNSEAITTSLADAVTAIPFLNDYTPVVATSLASTHRDAKGAFDLLAGSYWFNGRSYCLHAGKHAPATGSAYLLAPLKGPRAPIIEDILRNSAAHLEIPQTTVQQLIWAILAHTKLADTSTQLQSAAFKLLKPAEILQLNEGAYGVIPSDQLGGLLAKVPDPMKPVLDAENSLRSMLTSNAAYQDMERVAVLPPLGATSTSAAPELRWSYDPRGFFIWYTPHGYPWTTTYLDVPGAISVTRDPLGRITGLVDRRGNRVEASYASASQSDALAGDPQVHLYRLRSVRFVWKQVRAHGSALQQDSWSDPGSIMVGVPSGKGHVASSSGLANGQAAYDRAAALRDQFAGFLRQIGGRADALSELMALAEFRAALNAAAPEHASHAAWVDEELNFSVGAWESVLAHSVGGDVAASARAGVDQPFDPSTNTAVPQNTGNQRLAQSPGCTPSGNGSGDNIQQDIGGALELGGYPQWYVARGKDISYSSNGPQLWWSLNLDQGGRPIAQCSNQPPAFTVQGTVTKRHDGSYGANIAVSQGGKLNSTGSGSYPNDPVGAIARAAKNLGH